MESMEIKLAKLHNTLCLISTKGDDTKIMAEDVPRDVKPPKDVKPPEDVPRDVKTPEDVPRDVKTPEENKEV